MAMSDDYPLAKPVNPTTTVGAVGWSDTSTSYVGDNWYPYRWWPNTPTYIYPSITVSGPASSDRDSIKLAASVIKRLLTKEALEKFGKEERDELKLALAVLAKDS
jgi:predicted FMN-binding regulatory protein PaiB